MTTKKQYRDDKAIRDLYRSDQSCTDPYSEFKAKLKKSKNPF